MSGSSTSSEEENLSAESDPSSARQVQHNTQVGLPGSASADSAGPGEDRDIYSFVDRFRALVSQVSRETEDALQFARTDDGDLDHSDARSVSPDSYFPSSSSQYSPSVTSTFGPALGLGYDEFGRPYPPDEHVRILNGYIRRMPTIESIGSREVGSSVAASSVRGDDRQISSMHTLSRPPTRAMTDYSYTSSEPPSRSNSLSMAAELINAMSGSGAEVTEVGELVLGARGVGGGAYVGPGRSGSTSSHTASHPSMSRSTLSYYTAGSNISPPPTPFPVELMSGHVGADVGDSRPSTATGESSYYS